MSKNLRFLSTPLYVLLMLTAISGMAQPKINSFAPASGPAGTSVTISGSDFNSAAASNIVFFGAVKATVTSASATSLTVTVPAGATYQPLSVLNSATGLTGYAATPFLVTFVNPAGIGIPSNFFAPRNEYPTTNINNPAVAISDLDGDGSPDVIVTNYNDNSISIFRNTAVKGTIDYNSFRTKVDLTTGPSPTALTTGDLNGDGKPEIVVANFNNGTISVFQNIGNSISVSSFTRLDINMNINTRSVAIGDLDGDGRPDIVVGGNNSVRVVRNTFSGTGDITAASFAPWIEFPAMGGYSVIVGDLDGDRKLDVASTQGDYITAMRNISAPGALTSASFEPAISVKGAFLVNCVTMGDLDGDNKPELVAGGTLLTGVFVARNTSVPGSLTTNSFATPALFRFSSITPSIAIADMDGDEKPDIIAAVQGSGSMASPGAVSIMRNTSQTGSITEASFEPPIDFTTFSQSLGVAIGDLDGDGIPEIANSHLSFNVFTVLKAIAPPPLTTITSFSPASGPVGSTVTITGTNLGSGIFYFGAVRASVKGSASGGIEVIVPPGATNQPISVFNSVNFQTAYSAKPFIPTFSDPYRTTVSDSFYKPKIDFATNTVPFSAKPSLPFFVTSSDLNIDGKPEIVAVNASLNTVSIMLNAAAYGNVTNTSFGASYQFPVGADPRAAATGDINADGKPDVVVVNSGAGTVSVLINSIVSYGAAPSFASKIDFPVGANPFSVAIQDVNGDGKPDVVVANLGSGTVSVLRNIYTPGSSSTTYFAPAVNFAAGNTPRFVTISDLDGDSKPDIAVVNETSNTVSVLRNTAVAATINAASFAPMVSFATAGSPNCVSASDLDRDGKTDLVVSNFGSSTVSVLRNTAVSGTISATSFAPKVDYPTGPQPFFVTTGDADGDGKIDIITANSSADNLSLLKNTASFGSITAASFAPKKDFAAGSYPVSAMIGDLDADGEPELVAANAGTNNVSVLAFFPPKPPVITSFSPARGPVGTLVTITGTGFHPIASNNIVYFGARKATVVSGASGYLNVTVPAGASFEPISVLNGPSTLSAYSSKPFISTFNNPFGTGIPANFYRPKVDFNIGSNFAYGAASGDLDGDGRADLVGVNESTNTLTIFSERSSGTISTSSYPLRTEFVTAPGPRAVAVQDMDADGVPDLVVLSPSSNRISVLRNTSASPFIKPYTFVQTASIDAGTHISSFAVGDLDKDGRIDLVVTNQYTGTVSVFHGINSASPGSGAFAYKVEFPVGEYPRSVAISDVDGDGKSDIIVANERSNNISILRNTTVAEVIDANSFAPKVDFPAGTNPNSVAAGDLDGDGKTDIAVANYGSSTLSVLRNTSAADMVATIAFAPKVDFITGSNPFSLDMGDADGDGKIDLVTANATDNTISVLRNISTTGSIQASSFAAKTDFPASGYPLSVTMRDLDYDGIPEIISANAASGNISVLKISSPFISASTAASPAKGQAVESSTAGIQLYPNPTDGPITLQLSDLNRTAASVEVLNENGAIVEKRMVNTDGAVSRLLLDLRNQPAGVYYIKITGVKGVQMVKLIKR